MSFHKKICTPLRNQKFSLPHEIKSRIYSPFISSPTNAPTNFYYRITGDSKERNTVLPPIRQLNVLDLLRTDLTEVYCWKVFQVFLKVYCKKYVHTYEYEYHISVVMQILIPSTARAATIFLILSSPYGCICLTSFEDHFDTRQVVRSVSHFVNEFVEFVIVLGHGQSPILSSSFLDMDRTLLFRTSHFTNLMSQWDFYCESRSDECVRHCNPPIWSTTDCVRRWRWCALF